MPAPGHSLTFRASVIYDRSRRDSGRNWLKGPLYLLEQKRFIIGSDFWK